MHVALKAIHKIYGRGPAAQKILDDIHITFASGDFVAIMGPSGSGKSTLLNLIGCLDVPTYGQIFLGDRDIARTGESFREKVRLNHIGFVFQSNNLLPTLTVNENITLPMQLAGVSRSERASRCQKLLKMIGLEDLADQSARTLSGGQQQRVAVARALGNLPTLLLADEPTGSLDRKSSDQVMQVLARVNKAQKLTTIMVTHDPQVARYASHVFSLENGTLQSITV